MHDPDGTRYQMMDGAGGWMVGFAVAALILLVIAVVVSAASLALHLSPARQRGAQAGAAPRPEARRTLDLRVASGEITPEEYRVLCDVLDT